MNLILSICAAAVGAWLLLTPLDRQQPASALAGFEVHGTDNPRPLTSDGRSRFAGWSPDSQTVLINRWGTVVGGGTSRQVLSELWAIDLTDGSATQLSDNATAPSYAGNGRQLAVLSFAGDENWEVRWLDAAGDVEETWAGADWRTPPTWIGGELAFARDGRIWLAHEGAEIALADFPTPPAGARIRLSADGTRIAWSDGATGLWATVGPRGQPRLLTPDGPVLGFAWSPDGGRLAYVVASEIASEGLSPALWVADVAGGEAPTLLVQGRAETFSSPGWSPDGQQLVFSRTPLGSETTSASDAWSVNADGGELRPLQRNDREESSPVWSPDGRYLAFHRAGDVWVLDTTRPWAESSATAIQSGAPSPHKDRALAAPLVQQTPPVTIRVIHRQENYYRDVPAGQIDVIPFENYVKQCVPVEMPASWPMEALKVQAMAARTYAWHYVKIHADWDWDVSDWTDYQVMGREDQRHPRSDAATDQTQGQYVAYQGEVIKAFYSAENSSPTRSAAGYPYIQAVDDPVSFGRERLGHGWGMSQWGTSRWAAWHGWGYQQILAHYYTNVTIELPDTGGPMPLGGVTLPWSDHFVTGNRVHVVANASDEAGDVSAVGFYALKDAAPDATLLVTDTTGSDGWSTVWDVSALDDTTTSQAITLSLRVADGAGNVLTQTLPVQIGLDRQPPLTTSAAIGDAYTNTITVTLSSLSASDPEPGSGVQTMAFSNEGWTWEGEELYHLPHTGEDAEDVDALNGRAKRGLVGTHDAGIWYGPYTYALPPGHAYRAYFRLKTNDVTTTTEIGMLDVVDDGGERLLGLRRLRGTDFRAANVYQEFGVDFNYTAAGTYGLEFRVAFRAVADLYLDRVRIVSYPVPLAPSARWRLTPGEGLKTVTVKFADRAGNVSSDLTATVTLDTSPPTGWHDFTPQWWDGSAPPTCTVGVYDEISGLEVDSARYRFSQDEGISWSDWLTATCSGSSGTTETQTISASRVPFEYPSATANRIQFQVADVAGNTGTATYTVRSRSPVSITGPLVGTAELPYVAGRPYTFLATVKPLTGTVVQPITYAWQATHQAPVTHQSGLSDTATFTWILAGPKTVVVTASNAEGIIGKASRTIGLRGYVYLPLVVKRW